ncbi:MAG: hypothetical protein QGI52_04590 [Alphaproteobacteria bacterium]|nr:hypothetical protein [Alphaproteobacteria bacterium]MDP7641709.1 hypothetical protein [Alphaproteobacteria bacterium]
MQRRGFGNLDHQAARDLLMFLDLGGKRAQPGRIRRRQAGYVDREARIGAFVQLADDDIKDEAVDGADEAHFFGDRQKLAGGK